MFEKMGGLYVGMCSCVFASRPCYLSRGWSKQGRFHGRYTVKLLKALGRLWNWGCLPGSERYDDQLVKDHGFTREGDRLGVRCSSRWKTANIRLEMLL